MAFLRSLKTRGLTGTQLVISDVHAGLTGALAGGAARGGLATLPGAFSCATCWPGYQRATARWSPPRSGPRSRNPDAEHVTAQLDVIAGMLGRQFPTVETMLRDATEELLAFTGFPPTHWKKIW